MSRIKYRLTILDPASGRGVVEILDQNVTELTVQKMAELRAIVKEWNSGEGELLILPPSWELVVINARK